MYDDTGQLSGILDPNFTKLVMLEEVN